MNIESWIAQNVLHCYGAPFGARVSENHDSVHDENYSPVRFADEIDALRTGVRLLYSSTRREYVLAANRVNGSFYDQDGEAAHNEFPDVDENNILGWLNRATHKDFVSFCEWNVSRYDTIQRQLDADMGRIGEAVMHFAGFLVEIDLIPPSAEQLYGSELKKYRRLHIMDSFESGALGSSGYYIPGKIAVANTYPSDLEKDNTDEDELFCIAFHEFTHSVGEGMSFRNAVYTGQDGGSELLDEAFDEHVTQTAAIGLRSYAPIMNPDGRQGDQGVYRVDRALCGMFMGDEFGDRIPYDILGGAYFDPLHSPTHRELLYLLNKNAALLLPDFGPNAFEVISARHCSVASADMKDEYCHTLITKIKEQTGEASGVNEYVGDEKITCIEGQDIDVASRT